MKGFIEVTTQSLVEVLKNRYPSLEVHTTNTMGVVYLNGKCIFKTEGYATDSIISGFLNGMLIATIN